MGTKGKRRGYVSFLNQERNKEPACGVKATCIKLEVALATYPAPRGRENSHVRISASAIRSLEYFPFGRAPHVLRRFHRRATGA